MVTVLVLIKTDPHRIPEAAQDIANVDGVQAVYSVTGKWDLVAMATAPSLEDLGTLVPEQISKVATIHDTETMVAFRTFSKQDLAAGFDLGFDD